MSTNTVEVVEVPLASHIRLPAFSIRNPRLWFAQAEAHFCSHQIQSQKVMYSYIVTTLPTDIAEEVSDLILEVPKENTYDTLKEALISRPGVSDQRRLDELFGNIEIGDRSPSQFLRHMKKLLGNRELDVFSSVQVRSQDLRLEPKMCPVSCTVSPGSSHRTTTACFFCFFFGSSVRENRVW